MSTKKKVDGYLVCRACRRSLDKFCDAMVYLSSHDENFKEFQSVSDVFSKYTFLKIGKEEEITSCICIDCYELLVDFHKFRKMCVISHFELLKQRLSITECFVPLKRLATSEPEKPVVQTNAFDLMAGFDVDAEFDASLDSSLDASFDITEESEDEDMNEDMDVDDDFDYGPFRRMGFGMEIYEERPQKKEERYTCGFCLRIFTSKSSVDKHMLSIHKGSKYACSKCGLALLTFKDLKKHEHWHNGDQKITCDFCTFDTYNIRYMVTHLKKSHTIKKEEDSFKCMYCDMTCPNSTDMMQHVYDQIENIFECEDVNNCAENKIYKCNHCTGTFTRKSHWKMHMNGLPNLKSHICSVCEAKCTTQCELSRHMSQHKEKHTKSNCATCLRIFYTSECLQIHIRIAHDEPSPDVREALQRKKQPQHLGLVKREKECEIFDTIEEYILP